MFEDILDTPLLLKHVQISVIDAYNSKQLIAVESCVTNKLDKAI